MFCAKCGSQVPEGAGYCSKCGASQNAAKPIAADDFGKVGFVTANTKPIKSSKRNVLILSAAGVLAVAIIAFATVNLIANTGKNYIYTVMKNSTKLYGNEIGSFFNDNAVFKQINKLDAESWSLLCKSDYGKVSIHNDKGQKALSLTASINMVPAKLEAYLGTDRFIIGSPTSFYIEANPKKFGTDLASFADTIGFSSISDVIRTAFDSFDFSYTALENGGAPYEHSDEIKKLNSRYAIILKKLVDRSGYEKLDGRVEIGSKTADCDELFITLDQNIIYQWYREDLRTALKDDNTTKEMYNEYLNAMREYLDMYKSLIDYGDDSDIKQFEEILSYDYNDILDKLDTLFDELKEEEFDLTICLSVYKGVIVKAAIEVEDEYSSGVLSLEATGEKHRLDRIIFTANSGYDNYKYSIEGDHIGADVFTSLVNIDGEKIKIEWDTKATANNLRVTAGSESLKLTLAKDGEDVVFITPKDYYEQMSLTVSPLRDSVTLPPTGDTMKLRDITFTELIDVFQYISDEFGDLF